MTGAAAISRWRSPKAEQAFERLYAEAWNTAGRELERVGKPAAEQLETTTQYGITRVHHWSGSGRPILFVHGQATSSLMWVPLLMELEARDVYAVDTVGEPGASVQSRAIADISDLTSWLHETLDGLALRDVHLVATSFGGFVALHYAAGYGEMLASLTLLEPAVDRVTMGRFLRHGIAVGATQLLPRPVRRPVARALDAEPLLMGDRRLRQLGVMSFRQWDRQLPKYAEIEDAVPDSILTSVSVPTLAVFGERSELHHAAAAAERVGRLLSNVDVHVLDRASHALPVSRASEVADLVQAFLRRQDPIDITTP